MLAHLLKVEPDPVEQVQAQQVHAQQVHAKPPSLTAGKPPIPV